MFGKSLSKNRLIAFFAVLFVFGLLFILPGPLQATAAAPCEGSSSGSQGASGVLADGPEERCVGNACVGDCLSYQYFLSKSYEPWCRWYDTAYGLTGCGESAWKTSAEFLLDIAAELVEAPGAVRMQCWQMVMGQASVCSDQCEVNNCRYAPNVRLTLDSGAQGYTAVTVDNRDHSGGVPEREPTAYSRNFATYLYLRHGEGQKLLMDRWDVSSLSYPNWITRSGLDTCIRENGADDQRCRLLAPFGKPSEASHELNWGDGGLIDLTSLTKNPQGIDSQPSDGYIALKANGDRITVQQAALSGYVYVWEHNLSKNTYSETVSPWNASGGDQTFTNQECNCSVCWCRHVGFSDKVDRDTYVFATSGPSENLLLGDYTVEVEARLFHDKDISDNTVDYSYTLSENPPPPTGDQGEPTEDPVIEDVGGGFHYGMLSSGETYDLYRIQVPMGLAFMRVRLGEVPSPAQFALYLMEGELPTGNLYDCLSVATSSQDAICEEFRPLAGDYYVKVERQAGTGQYTLEVDLATVPLPRPTSISPAVSVTPSPPPPDQFETEPNNSPGTATSWDAGQTMGGKLNTKGDIDIFRLSIPEPGIYTVNLSDVPANIKPRLEVYTAQHSLVASHYPAAAGMEAKATFDANAGEMYFVRVKASDSYPQQVSESFYVLSASSIPDPSEPNDSSTRATPWDFTAGPVHGYFWDEVSGPWDYYVFSVPDSLGSVLLTVNLSDVAANVKPRLEVYNARNSLVASHYPAGLGAVASVSFDANAGESYFLRVKAGDSPPGQVSNSPYTLSATTIADPNEPNDSSAKATPWDFTAGPANGYFWDEVTGPWDYYVFSVPDTLGSVLLTVNLNDVPANVKPRLEVYTAQNSLIASHYPATAGMGASVTFDANAGERYLVRVKATDSYPRQVSTAPYALSVTTIPDPGEPNDSSTRATRWDFTAGPAHGYFWDEVSGPWDYYVLTVPQSLGSVILTVNLSDVPANVKPRLEVYTAQNSLIASDYPTGLGAAASVSFDANAGKTYLVRVKASDSPPGQVSKSPYTLTVATVARTP